MKDWKYILYEQIKNDEQFNQLNKTMGTYTITKEEYNQLLTIKCNAKLLAVTMNEDAQKIVNDLCEDYDNDASVRLKKVLENANELLNKLKNENRH
tara:strand:+ start:405 stop:692 length:288 start_codon:yes stop_codon:yes gene_type:complete